MLKKQPLSSNGPLFLVVFGAISMRMKIALILRLYTTTEAKPSSPQFPSNCIYSTQYNWMEELILFQSTSWLIWWSNPRRSQSELPTIKLGHWLADWLAGCTTVTSESLLFSPKRTMKMEKRETRAILHENWAGWLLILMVLGSSPRVHKSPGKYVN